MDTPYSKEKYTIKSLNGKRIEVTSMVRIRSCKREGLMT